MLVTRPSQGRVASGATMKGYSGVASAFESTPEDTKAD
jgi:hypothetical protein